MNTQRGVVLIVSLVMLMLLTLLATSSMQNATLQEKMAGSQALRNASFQSAETLLRLGEAQVFAAGFSMPTCASPLACLPPPEALTLTSVGLNETSGIQWRVGQGGFFGIQLLGETDNPAGAKLPSEPQQLYRVTAVGIQGASRTVLESVHTQEKRIMWRQRR